ncbi:hypothetical protein WN48_02389 [Eufriesea mexicana]|nr:hypothetical protein WN48_02389 [Eufriesea mexicana]
MIKDAYNQRVHEERGRDSGGEERGENERKRERGREGEKEMAKRRVAFDRFAAWKLA